MKYTYYFRLRPPSIGTQPKDFIEFSGEPIVKNKKEYWGYVVYNRKLTESEMYQYDLDYIED